MTIDGGEIISLPGGDVQVYDEGSGNGAPIVLLHCYSCSLHWWDHLAPILAENHRVIRIDLLGHGGSAEAVERLLDRGPGRAGRRGARPARRPGRGRGRALDGIRGRGRARRPRQPTGRPGGQTSTRGPTQLTTAPPLTRQARLRAGARGGHLASEPRTSRVKDATGDAFAPGYEISRTASPNPDQVVNDYNAMTFTSFKEARAGGRGLRGRDAARPAPPPDPPVPLLVDLRRRGPDLRPGHTPRTPTRRSPARRSKPSGGPGTHPTSRSPTRPRR